MFLIFITKPNLLKKCPWIVSELRISALPYSTALSELRISRLTLFDGTFRTKNIGLTLFDGILGAKNIGLTLFDGTFGPNSAGYTSRFWLNRRGCVLIGYALLTSLYASFRKEKLSCKISSIVLQKKIDKKIRKYVWRMQ